MRTLIGALPLVPVWLSVLLARGATRNFLGAWVLRFPYLPATVAKKAGLKVLAYYGDVLRMPLGGLGTSDEFILKRGDVLKRVLRGTLKGIGFLRQKDRKSEVVKLMVDWFSVNSETATDSYDQIIQAYPPDGKTSAEVLEKDLEISRQLGAIKGTVPLSRVVNFKMLDEVARELGLK